MPVPDNHQLKGVYTETDQILGFSIKL